MERLASGGQPEIPCPQKLMHKMYGFQHTVSRIWGTAVPEESIRGGGGRRSFVPVKAELWAQLCELLEGLLW